MAYHKFAFSFSLSLIVLVYMSSRKWNWQGLEQTCSWRDFMEVYPKAKREYNRKITTRSQSKETRKSNRFEAIGSDWEWAQVMGSAQKSRKLLSKMPVRQWMNRFIIFVWSYLLTNVKIENWKLIDEILPLEMARPTDRPYKLANG